MRFQRAESPAHLKGFQAARRFFASCFGSADRSRERLWVAHVDARARCIYLDSYDGDSSSIGLPVRAIIADAAKLGTAGLILAHNHPGGDPTPSRSDCLATRTLAQACDAVKVVILDHLVFANGEECRSMRRMGLL